MTIGASLSGSSSGASVPHLGVREVDRARQVGVLVVGGGERLDDGDGVGVDELGELGAGDEVGHVLSVPWRAPGVQDRSVGVP